MKREQLAIQNTSPVFGGLVSSGLAVASDGTWQAKKHIKRTLMLLAICGIAFFLCGSGRAAMSIDVPARSFGWVDSGMNITAGSYFVTATGIWSPGGGIWVNATSLDSWPPDTNMTDEFFAGANRFGMVAFVGNVAPANGVIAAAPAGTPGYFAVLDGTHAYDFPSGKLYFVINDDATGDRYWYDNYGSINVVVAPVPEPSTFIAGLLLLLPFGAGSLRLLRRGQVA